jgi:hypothetical protein
MRKLSLLKKTRPSAQAWAGTETLSFVDLPRLPPEPTAAGVSELSGWWLEARPACRCGKTKHFSFQRICEIAHPYDPTLREILPRVKCQSCGAGPGSIYLTDLAAEDQVGTKEATFRLRLR